MLIVTQFTCLSWICSANYTARVYDLAMSDNGHLVLYFVIGNGVGLGAL